MKPITYAFSGALVVLALSLGAPDVWAQSRGQHGGGGGGGTRTNSGGGGGGGTAVARGSGGSSGSSGSSGGGGHVSSGGGTRTAGPSSTGSSSGTAAPRGARDNSGGHPVIGQATERTSPYAGRYRDGSYYRNYRYYPYDPYYLYGYGAFGLGLGAYYYDPFLWGYPYGYGYGYGSGGYGYPWGYGDGGYYGGGGGYGGGYYDYDRRNDDGVKGGVKLKVSPKDADVFVDGYFVGRVDDYNGLFQRLNLVAGSHHIEFKARGYETLSVDVKVEPRETISYHGELQPAK